ncbi:PAS domain S-box protein [Methylobacterium komagatae]|uniref:Blue-light-activated histidine kinase n=1 Tax=Methylobacterium komagatae TaxID=374425 RepID=A0ABW2BND5_9HYPH
MRDAEGRACRMIGAMLDLTARKRAEDAMRESERRLGLERGLLEAIFLQAPVGISIAGAEAGVPSSLNAKAEEILGHGLGTEGDARYVSYGAMHPDGRRYEPAEYPTLRALRRGETVRGEEMRYRIPGTGEMRLLEVSSGPVRDAEGAIQAAVTVLADVGDKRRADAETRRLAALVEQSQDFIGLAAPDGSVDFVNEAGRRLIGLPDLAAARAMPIVDYFVPEERARVLDEVLPAVERDGFWEGELHFRHVVTGAAVPVLYNLFPVRGADGRKLGYGTVTRDLTEQHRARQALQASEASLRAVLDTVPVGILFAEAPSGRIVGGNRRLEDIFRHSVLPSPDVESYGEWVAFHEDGRRVAPDEYPLSRIIREGHEHAEMRCEYQRGDGSRLWIEIAGAPMRDEAGAVVGAVVAVADIDARRRAEERQDLLNQELSHRMKNLLAMVQAIAASTLRGATDMDAAREVLGSRLVALGKAHDVLLGGAAESASLAAVVREGVGVQESAGRRVRFEGPDVEIGGKAALSLALTLHELDHERGQVRRSVGAPRRRVGDLLAGGAGGRAPAAHRMDGNRRSAGRAAIAKGVRVAADRARADRAGQRRPRPRLPPGGGDLRRRGVAGRLPGRRMTMRRNEGPAGPLPLAMTDAPNAKTALVVEDEMIFRLEVRDLLEADGYAVVEAGNAAQALERLDDWVVLVVTDVRMPGPMDGLALAREVACRRPDVAVVVVSAQMRPRPGDLPGHVPFVERPFLESRFRDAVRRAEAARTPYP